jgi:hypothetical protein
LPKTANIARTDARETLARITLITAHKALTKDAREIICTGMTLAEIFRAKDNTARTDARETHVTTTTTIITIIITTHTETALITHINFAWETAPTGTTPAEFSKTWHRPALAQI